MNTNDINVLQAVELGSVHGGSALTVAGTISLIESAIAATVRLWDNRRKAE